MNLYDTLIPQPAVVTVGRTIRTAPTALALSFRGMSADEAHGLRWLSGMVLKPWLGGGQGGAPVTVEVVRDANGGWAGVPVRARDLREQSYHLRIGRRIRLMAGSLAGLRHGLQTLRQILESAGDNGGLPDADIRDWPRLAQRGMHVDLAREMEYRPAYFRRIVEHCAYFKLNQLHLYLENRFEFPSAPGVAGPGAITVRQARELCDYAALWGITVVPQIQTLGHMNQILHGDYAEMREDPAHPENLCPTHPRARAFLAGLIGDAVSAFRSPYLHVGYDESKAGVCPRCRAEGSPSAILGRHLAWIVAEVRGHGVEPMIYADKFLPHDELPLLCASNCATGKEAREALRTVPRDLILTNWHYFSPHSRSVRWLRREGFERIYCTTASNLFISNAVRLIRGARWIAETMEQDIADGAVGALNCNWEMYRGQTLDNAWALNALAADRGWSARPHDAAGWTRRFAARFYGVEDDTFGYLFNLAEAIPTQRLDQFLDRPVLEAEVQWPMAPAPYGWVGWDNPETGAELIRQARVFRRRAVRHRDTLCSLDMPGEIIRYVGLRVRYRRFWEDALKAGRRADGEDALRVLESAVAHMQARLARVYRVSGNALEDRRRIALHAEQLRSARAQLRRAPAHRLSALLAEAKQET